MTEEEIEKKAEEWLIDNLHTTEEDYKQSFIAGAKLMQKENKDLQHRLDVAQGFLDRDKEYQEMKEQLERMEYILKNQGCRFCEYYKGKAFEEPCKSCSPTYDKWKLTKE